MTKNRAGGEGSTVDVSILVVSYNTRALTLDALRSVFDETRDVSFEVIVVDNASSDGSADAISKAYPGVRLIALNRNIGFAAANNLASTLASGRYILLLNPDTLVCDQAIDRLHAFARAHRDARIWGGRTVFADGSLNASSCWGKMTLWNLFCRASGLAAVFRNVEFFNGEAFGGWRRDTVREVDIVSGCFFLIERALWVRLGGFAPIFFMYGEEADLCLRARKLGARPLVTPEAQIVHIGGASETVRDDKMIKLLAAKATLIERHVPRYTRTLGLWLLMAWPLSRMLALDVVSRISGRARHRDMAASWRAVWQARKQWSAGYPMYERGARDVAKAESGETYLKAA